MDTIINETKQKMQKSLEVLQQDFATVRSGKANPGVVENISIEAYEGTWLKVMELATVSAQDHQTLLISPFDKSVMGKIQKGIEEANIGMNPVASGDVLRIVLPPLTEERRKEFVKLISQKAESGKIMIRQARHEAMDAVKKEKENGASEDDVARLEKEIQKLTDDFIAEIEDMKTGKEKELMQI